MLMLKERHSESCQLFNEFSVLRIGSHEFRPHSQLEISKIESRCDSATDQRKPRGIFHPRGKPAARFDNRLKHLTLIRTITQVQLGIIPVRTDDVNHQRTPGIKMPHLVGCNAMKSRKIPPIQQKINRRRCRSISLVAGRQSTANNGEVRLVSNAVVAALRVRAQAKM